MSATLNGGLVGGGGGGASLPVTDPATLLSGATASRVVATSAGGVGTLLDAAASRTLLGLGSLATASGVTASQISDGTTAGRALLTAAAAPAQRTALGLGGAATLSVGTTAGTVAAGDDSRITGALQSSTLTTRGDLLRRGASSAQRFAASTSGTVVTGDGTDVVSAAIATPLAVDASGNRTALGLGGAAVLSVGTTAGTVAAGNDARLASTGLDSARPAAGTAGAQYLATDSGVMYLDSGTAWRGVLGSPDGVGLSGWAGASGRLTTAPITGGTASTTALLTTSSTWYIRWYQGTVAGGTQRLFVTYTNGARGWQIAMSNPTANRIGIILFGLNGTTAIEVATSITTGWHCAAFAVSTTGSTVVHTLDGAAATTVATTGTYLPPVSADTFSIGAGRVGDVPLQSDTGLYEMGVISSALSAAQIATLTASPGTARTVLPAGATLDFGIRPAVTRLGGDGASWLSLGANPRVVTRAGTLTQEFR